MKRLLTTLMILFVLVIVVFVGMQWMGQGTKRNGPSPAANNDKKSNQLNMTTFSLRSSAFEHNGPIPREYTCQGQDMNPPLSISNTPEGTVSLALVLDDPDAPAGTWDHWVVWNIDPATTEIAAGSVPVSAVQGLNSWKRNDYGGPCPPSGSHRYFFTVYAIDTLLDIAPQSTKQDLMRALKDHVIASSQLVGTYQKQ